jgi:hypothetical protein
LRSRGSYIAETLTHRVTGNNSVSISGANISNSPFAEFTLSVTDIDNDVKDFTVSLDKASSKYINKVIGEDVIDKDKEFYKTHEHCFNCQIK